MTISNSDAHREAAFSLVADVVQGWYDEGRCVYSASLKPELKRRTGDAFDETALGFSGFREFLNAAAEANHVDVHPAPHGPDIQVVPTGREPLTSPPATEGRAAKTPLAQMRVRDDLWMAFVDWDRLYDRYYDREANEAFLLPSNASPLESEEVRERRSLLATASDRFVEIEPIGFEGQVAWMHEFTQGQASDVRVRLLASLEGERPARGFGAAVREQREVAHAWQRFRTRKVAERVGAWARENDLAISVEAKPQKVEEPTPPRSAKERPATVDDVRAKLHAAIDEMSLSELGAMSVPLRYVVDLRA